MAQLIASTPNAVQLILVAPLQPRAAIGSVFLQVTSGPFQLQPVLGDARR